MTDETPRCHFAGNDQPRMLRTHVRDCEDSACGGCVPCPERHCRVCYREEVTVDGRGTDETCTGCLREVRENLANIWELSTRLLGEALVKGVNSQAAMLAGPASEREGFRQRVIHAFTLEGCREYARCPMHNPNVTAPEGPACQDCEHRVCILIRRDCVTVRAIHQDNRDELHPLTVLGDWEGIVRDHLDQSSTDRILVSTARDYLNGHLTRLAHDQDFPFDELRDALKSCREHLEAVLHDGEQVDRGAPCPMCAEADLEKQHGDKVEDDRWVCPRRDCRASYTDHDYRAKVEAVYVLRSETLTASQIAATYRVPEGTVRRWSSEKTVKTHGKDQSGRQLYNVADVLAQRDRKASA